MGGGAENMNAITYGLTSTSQDLLSIIELQKANLPANITAEEKQQQGFVTVVHSIEDLTKLHDIEPHVIAKADDRVVAYLLAMTAASSQDIPVLVPMFNIFNQTVFQEKCIAEYQYLVVGQVCVDKAFRGQGILDQCYQEYRRTFADKYDFAITEIDGENRRSLRAHQRIGFEEIVRYQSPDGTDWSIVLWDWNA